MEYEIQEIPEATYAVIEQTVAFSGVPNVMPRLMERLETWASTVPHGLQVCISAMTSDRRLKIAPGVGVEPGSVEPPEGFDLVTRPAARSAVHLCVGPYEGLPGVYQAFNDQLLSDGYAEKGEPIEIYEKHDPVPETRIIWPIERTS